MIKQLQDRKIQELEARLDQSYRLIKELIAGLDCPSDIIRGLIKDTAISYMKVVDENFKDTLVQIQGNGREDTVTK